MVEYVAQLDDVFSSLADPTRRDILQRLMTKRMTISEIAWPYELTFAAVSKHLKVLEKANLIIKERSGKQQMVSVAPQALKDATEYLDSYRLLWAERHEALDKFLKEMQ